MSALRDELVEMLEQENDDLRQRCRRLEEICGFRFEAPPQFLLTASETKIFGGLFKSELMHKDMLMDALQYVHTQDEPAIKIIDVYVCKVRGKVRPWNITIETVWGQGYRMPAASKAITQALLDEIQPRREAVA